MKSTMSRGGEPSPTPSSGRGYSSLSDSATAGATGRQAQQHRGSPQTTTRTPASMTQSHSAQAIRTARTLNRSGKGRKFPAEVLSPEEVKALIRACSTRAPTGVRNRALLVVLYRGGLRVGEALALYPKDVDPQRGTVQVLHGKGDKARTVGLDPEALAVVERWVDVRRSLGISARRRLFCTLVGGPLDSSYVRQLLPRLAGRAGIDKRVHAHGLRHTHAAELAEEGYPVNFIQDQLGHASLAVTDRYLRHIAPAARIEALQRRSWGL
jgi:site-specific recombinase XerD